VRVARPHIPQQNRNITHEWGSYASDESSERCRWRPWTRSRCLTDR
jgi:hypothetical protein